MLSQAALESVVASVVKEFYSQRGRLAKRNRTLQDLHAHLEAGTLPADLNFKFSPKVFPNDLNSDEVASQHALEDKIFADAKVAVLQSRYELLQRSVASLKENVAEFDEGHPRLPEMFISRASALRGLPEALLECQKSFRLRLSIKEGERAERELRERLASKNPGSAPMERDPVEPTTADLLAVMNKLGDRLAVLEQAARNGAAPSNARRGGGGAKQQSGNGTRHMERGETKSRGRSTSRPRETNKGASKGARKAGGGSPAAASRK